MTDIKDQCSSKLSVDSPLLIYIQHQLIIKMCLLRWLSIVKFFLRVAVHTKNATFCGTSAIQIPFHGKEKLVILLRAVQYDRTSLFIVYLSFFNSDISWNFCSFTSNCMQIGIPAIKDKLSMQNFERFSVIHCSIYFDSKVGMWMITVASDLLQLLSSLNGINNVNARLLSKAE